MNADHLDDPVPTVSVGLAVYNAGCYLREAVDSILEQTYTDFELLAYDDGSMDDSLAILKEYELKDSRVRVFSRENRGLPATHNEMIDLARGRYMARMDADDISLPDRFALQVAFLDANQDVVVVGSWVETINEYGQVIASLKSPTEHADIDRLNLTGHSSIVHPTAMIRQTALIEVGGYDKRMEVALDFDLWLQLAEVGKLANLPTVCLQYRLHSGAISESRRELQGQLARLACERAWTRRGIEGKFDPTAVDFRPGNDLESQHKYALRYGWMSWNGGHMDTWWTYAKRVIALKPMAISSWKLLIFGFIKSPK